MNGAKLTKVKVPAGTATITLRFTVSEAGSATIVISRRLPGRRRGATVRQADEETEQGEALHPPRAPQDRPGGDHRGREQRETAHQDAVARQLRRRADRCRRGGQPGGPGHAHADGHEATIRKVTRLAFARLPAASTAPTVAR